MVTQTEAGASQVVLVVKNLLASAGDARDVSLISGSEKAPGERNGNLLQYSCLENPMDRGAWWATAHRVAKSWTRLSTHVHGVSNEFSETLSLNQVLVFP